MGYTGTPPNQVYQRTDSVRVGTSVHVQARNSLVNDTAELMDAHNNDLADAINLLLLRNGGNMPTANIDWNTFKIINMGQGSARSDSLRIDQVQDGDLTYAEASGTANAIALATTPACTPVEGMLIGFFAEADNTGATTINLNGGGALALQIGGDACVGGEVNNGAYCQVAFDGTQWQLVNVFVNGRVSAIAAITPSDNTVIIGNGTTFVGESGATLLTSIGLGTGNTPQFTGIEVGNASDSTLTRASAGDLNIEGNRIFRVGGADVPVADGGTGASTAAAAATNLGLGTGDSPQFTAVNLGNATDTTLSRLSAGVPGVEGTALLRENQNLSDVASAATSFANIKQAASDSATGVIEIAVQSEMETGTDTTRAVTPGRQHFHPGHPKAWLYVIVTATVPALTTSYNITSISDDGVGNLGVTIATNFSDANYAVSTGVTTSVATAVLAIGIENPAPGSITLRSNSTVTANAFDPIAYHAAMCGAQ